MAFPSSLPSLDEINSLEDVLDTFDQEEVKAWAPIVGGGVLVLYGLSRRSLAGLLLAGAGGLVLYRGLVPRPTMMRTGASITINKSPEELYTFWRNLENLPSVMHNLVSVQEIDDKRSRWTARTVGGATIEWEAEIADEEPNHYIAWKSDHEAEIKTYGIVRFVPTPGNRGTEVQLILKYSLPLGFLGAADAAMMGAEPSQQAGQDLQRFKQYMETGEIATISGQPAGERGMAPDVETAAGVINNVLEGLNILRSGGRRTQGRAGTRV
jgi:uncharacterized membrane protein